MMGEWSGFDAHEKNEAEAASARDNRPDMKDVLDSISETQAKIAARLDVIEGVKEEKKEAPDTMGLVQRIRENARKAGAEYVETAYEKGPGNLVPDERGTMDWLTPPVSSIEAVRLSDAETKAVEDQVSALFAMDVTSPQFSTYTDRFHLRVPSESNFTIEDSPTTNVNLTLELMSDLREILGDLFPQEKKVPRGWDFKTEFDRASKQISIIIKMLSSGKNHIADDLKIIDAQKEHYHAGIMKLRYTLVAVTALRKQVEYRADRSSAIIKNAMIQKVIFYLVQREQDLLTELAVTTQTYLAMDARRHTNVTLMQNIERILSTTVQALSNAVYVANNVAGDTLNFAFDTRQIVMGYSGVQIRTMIDQFVALDRDLELALEPPAPTFRPKDLPSGGPR
jgi:hypothetical protein